MSMRVGSSGVKKYFKVEDVHSLDGYESLDNKDILFLFCCQNDNDSSCSESCYS